MAGEQPVGDTRLFLKNLSRTQADPAVIEGEVQPSEPHYTFDTGDALLRIGAGGAVELIAQLLDRVQAWEADAVANPKTLELNSAETSADLVRYALIGLLFEGQHFARSGAKKLGGWAASVIGLTTAVTRPVLNWRIMSPVRRSADDWRDQLEAYLVYLIQSGRGEELVGRKVATDLTLTTIDEVIRLLAKNEEIGDLVTSQGTSLAGEVVVGVRQHTIGTDTFIEDTLRRLLGRPRRADLPPPPEVVQRQAAPLAAQPLKDQTQ